MIFLNSIKNVVGISLNAAMTAVYQTSPELAVVGTASVKSEHVPFMCKYRLFFRSVSIAAMLDTFLIVAQHTTAKASDIATYLYRFSCPSKFTSLLLVFTVITFRDILGVIFASRLTYIVE